MKNILHLSTSPHGENSFSIKLGNSILSQLVDAFPGSTVTVTDLTIDPFPHLDPVLVKAVRTREEEQTDEHKKLLKRSNAAIAQLKEADIIIISLPLFNFGIPSVLKTWLDNVVRGGVTFTYTPEGPKGLLSGKKVYIALASGGVYSQGPMQAYDHAIPYLKDVLGFIGINDVSVVRAEGIGVPALRELALEKAIEEVVL